MTPGAKSWVEAEGQPAVRTPERRSEGHRPTRTDVYLHPGQLFVSSDPSAVTTILGSCVAICLWDPLLRQGGANHYLLPQCVGTGLSSPRFGNVAVQCLIDGILALGSQKHNLRAKVFGGACVIEAFAQGGHLGTKNADLGLRILREEGIPVVAEDVGGRRGRKVIFHTDSGLALVRLI
jgi:chemotaxis protein CheD